MLITAAVGVSALLLCVLLMREKSHVTDDTMSLAPLRNVNIWILGAIWACFNMAVIGYTTWGKAIFVRYDGLPASFSGFLASLLMLAFLTNPLTGFISDKFGRRRFFIILSSISMSLIFPLFPYSEVSLFTALALMLGLLASFLPPVLFALPEEILGTGKGALGWGVLNTFVNLGILIGPLTLGYVLDVTNSKEAAFFSMALFSLGSLILALLLKAR